MDIVMDNYIIWIIVAIVIILMTIIGYIAEKTDFGKKELSKRGKLGKTKIKKSKRKGQEEQVEEEQVPLDNNLEKNVNQEETSVSQNFDALYKNMSAIPTGYVNQNVSSLDEEWNLSSGGSTNESAKEIVTPTEDLNAPLNDSMNNKEISKEFNMPEPEKSPVIKRIEEDLNAPFGDEPIRENQNGEASLNLPDIDSVKEEPTFNNETEEDIWKF